MGLIVHKIVAINDATANASSSSLFVGNYSKVGVKLKRSNHSAGSSTFYFLGGFEENAGSSPVMSVLNTMIDNLVNNSVQTLTRVQNKALSADGEAFLWLSPETPITHLQIAVVEGTDGTHRAEVYGFEEEC